VVSQTPGGEDAHGLAGDSDSEGRRLLTTGSWIATSTPEFSIKGGQVMHFAVTNINVLGVSIRLEGSNGQVLGGILLPGMTGDYVFSAFGNEPMQWTFSPSIDTDASVVTWKLFSSWVPGDPPNG